MIVGRRTDRAGRLIPAASVSVRDGDRKEFLLKKTLDNPPIFREDPRVMEPTPQKELAEFRSRSL